MRRLAGKAADPGRRSAKTAFDWRRRPECALRMWPMGFLYSCCLLVVSGWMGSKRLGGTASIEGTVFLVLLAKAIAKSADIFDTLAKICH